MTDDQLLTGSDLTRLSGAGDDEVVAFFHALETNVRLPNDATLAEAFRHLVQRLRMWDRQQRRLLPAACVPVVEALYRRLGPHSRARCYLLQLLSASGGPAELSTFTELVISDPPSDAKSALVAFGPLFQHSEVDAASIFPRLLDAIQHESVAAPTLDLANHWVRSEQLAQHPATDRSRQLAALLGELVQRLGQLEESPDKYAATAGQLAQQIEDSIALAVALCDALALSGDRAATGKLYQALEVRHRRLHAEAAAALARLGESAGGDALVALAADPVMRLRVLKYADELGLSDRIDEQFTSEMARAESELALWLAQPAQVGIPPVRLELLDSRTLYWPGYEEPVDCFLFRFTYQIDQHAYSNVGIVGPVTHAFAADLLDLSPDDIFAAFAGWHVEHAEIFELDVNELNEAQRVDVARLERRLRDDRFDELEPQLLGFFLGDRVLAARASREGAAGTAVADARDSLWFPSRNSRRPIGATEALYIYKGRRLLRTFN